MDAQLYRLLLPKHVQRQAHSTAGNLLSLLSFLLGLGCILILLSWYMIACVRSAVYRRQLLRAALLLQ